VIFAEDPNIMKINDDVTLMRTRRAIFDEMKSVMQRNYRRPSVFSTLWNFLLDKFRIGRKKIKYVKDEIMCFRTKIEYLKMKIKKIIRENREGKKRNKTTTTTTEKVSYRITTKGPTILTDSKSPFGPSPYIKGSFDKINSNTTSELESYPEVSWVSNLDSKKTFGYDGLIDPEGSTDNSQKYDNYGASNLIKKRLRRQIEKEMNSMDDCISGMKEPMYGFRTMITTVEDTPCDLSTTCKLNTDEKKSDAFSPR